MRSRRLLFVGVLSSLPFAIVACRGGGGARAKTSAKENAPQQSPTETETPVTPLPHESVRLYFPSASTEGLVEETREILRTTTAGDRAKQILSDLLAGPTDDAALSFVPAGTRLRQVYVLDNGTAYADFSEEIRSGMGGGSEAEILTVYSIVNSLALNIQEIRRVGILVEGRPCETLNGHLDLHLPLKPDRRLIFDARPDEGTEPGKTIARNEAPPPRRGA